LRGKQEGIEQTERKGYNSKFVNKLEEEWLQFFDYVERMERTRIVKRVLELKFKGKGPMGKFRR
jgi:hypothetical protein